MKSAMLKALPAASEVTIEHGSPRKIKTIPVASGPVTGNSSEEIKKKRKHSAIIIEKLQEYKIPVTTKSIDKSKFKSKSKSVPDRAVQRSDVVSEAILDASYNNSSIELTETFVVKKPRKDPIHTSPKTEAKGAEIVSEIPSSAVINLPIVLGIIHTSATKYLNPTELKLLETFRSWAPIDELNIALDVMRAKKRVLLGEP